MGRLIFTPEQFFDGLLAAIRLQRDEGVIEDEPTESTVLSIECSRNSGRAESFDVGLFEVDYDPL